MEKGIDLQDVWTRRGTIAVLVRPDLQKQ
jgi:hypothetical protein